MSTMNESKSEKEKQQAKKKNIREIYLKAVKNDKGFYRRGKKKGFTNLPKSNSDANFNASAYLEKEYTLVKRIIQDTKELKTIKTKSDAVSSRTDLASSTATSRPSTAPSFKSPEDLSRELLELKKTLKVYQENELVNRAKFEYYDNELSKKEQEIIELLDNKKNEELRMNSDSKSDLLALIYHLKQKAYKLEFSLKRKDNELNKLTNEIKTTNLKELKAQNERLRVELSKSLMNDKKIIEAFEKEGVIERNGYSYYDSERRKNESELSLYKKEKLKENIAQQLSEDKFEDEEQFRAALKDFKRKMPLKGTLKQKLEILDLRENELLKEIERLNELFEKQAIDEKLKLSGSMSSLRKEHVSRRESPHPNDERRNKSVEKIQSILRGHMERVNSLNRNSEERQRGRGGSDDEEIEEDRGSRRSLRREDMMRQMARPSSRSSPLVEPPHRKNSRRGGRGAPLESSSSDISTARSDANSSRTLIDDKNVSEVETKGGCCGGCKSNKKK